MCHVARLESLIVLPTSHPPSPSRNSFMSGRRPDTTFVWDFNNHFREPDVGLMWATLPQYFKQHGYLTLGGGKLFHPEYPPMNDMPWSWSEGYDYFPNQPANKPHKCLEQFPENDPTYCIADVDKDDACVREEGRGMISAGASLTPAPFTNLFYPYTPKQHSVRPADSRQLH